MSPTDALYDDPLFPPTAPALPRAKDDDPRDKHLTTRQRANHRKLARVIHAHMAQALGMSEHCEGVCKRRGRCAYLQPDRLAAGAPDYLVHNLRRRDMPLCLAAVLDERGYADFRALVNIALG